MKKIIVILFGLIVSKSLIAQTELLINKEQDSSYHVKFTHDNDTLKTPIEGLWSIALGWDNNWMSDWLHVKATHFEKNDKWTIVKGVASLPQGQMLLSDAYSQTSDGLIHCIRRFEWTGKEALDSVTLSTRLQMSGHGLSLFAPGIVYYGNKNGASVNPNLIATWNGEPGEFAIFEEHRYPMPLIMLEDNKKMCAAALHVLPSPIRGAVLSDQWWSLGVEAKHKITEFVMYSGPIGYNKKYSVAKALQTDSMSYPDTWINMEPGRVIEKQFYIDLYKIERRGTGFQRPVYTSIDLHKPYDASRFDSFEEIVNNKYRFAKSRWLEKGEIAGYSMYDTRSTRKHIVMGWCGQADSPGYSLQVLSDMLADRNIHSNVQRTMDFLSTYPFREDGLFNVLYDLNTGEFLAGDPVSCGQAMYNFAKAIEYARKNTGYDITKWELFLKTACDKISQNILSESWNPISTAEGFLIAPLAISSELFDNKAYREAAEKAALIYAERHLEMNGCYWGGT